MPLELQVIRASEFVRLGTGGHLDLDASREALRELASACRKRGIGRALLDLRRVRIGPKPVFTPDDVASLVNTFPEVGFTRQHRLAVLYVVDPHNRAKMFAFFSSIRGWKVRAFNSYEDAVLWLSEPDDAAQDEEGGEEIPLKPTRTKSKASKGKAAL